MSTVLALSEGAVAVELSPSFKCVDPLCGSERLKLPTDMGHDDALVLADANFILRKGVVGEPLRE